MDPKPACFRAILAYTVVHTVLCRSSARLLRAPSARNIVPLGKGSAIKTDGVHLLQTPPGLGGDPIVTGFDGQVFDFHATGDYSLLATEEWKVGHSFGSKSARRPAYIHLRL